jgi:hypothetical protein
VPLVPTVAAPVVSALGPCTIEWIGADGAWETAANWSDTASSANRVPVAADIVCIDDADTETSLVVTANSGKTVAGLSNAEDLRIGSITVSAGGEVLNSGALTQGNFGSVSLGEAAQVTNSGTWTMGTSSNINGTVDGDAERFVNIGTLVKTGTGASSIAAAVRVDNTGTIDVQQNTLNILAPGLMPTSTYQVAEGATLEIRSDTTSQVTGVQSATGTGTVRYTGTLAPTVGSLTFAFPPGLLELSNPTFDTTSQPIVNTGTMPLSSSTINGTGFTNSGSLTQANFGSVSLGEAAQVTNSGTWTMGTSSNINGTTGGDAERFVNTGTLVRTGANTSSIAAAVRVDNTGTIDVQQNTLFILAPGLMPASTYQVAEGATLEIRSDTTSQVTGVQSATGSGTVRYTGTLAPTVGSLTFAFPPGLLEFSNPTFDTTSQPIVNTGTMPLSNSTINATGFTNSGALTQGDFTSVSLGEAAQVTNSGTWTMGTSSNINGTTGGDAERFVNTGTLVRTGANTSSIAAAVRVDNTGTIDVQQNTLFILAPGLMPASTYQVAEGATLEIRSDTTSQVTGMQSATGSGTVRYTGTLAPTVGSLTFAFPPGLLEFSNPTFDTTSQPIVNTGTMPLGSSTINGTGFTNSGSLTQGDLTSVSLGRPRR